MIILSKPTVLEDLDERAQQKKNMYCMILFINNSGSCKLIYSDRKQTHSSVELQEELQSGVRKF